MMNKCKKHPKYKGIYAPRNTNLNPTGCQNCWKIYLDKNIDNHLQAAGFKRVV